MRKLENIRFGIEIEVEFPEAEDSYSLISKHRIIPGWTIDDDGSLDNGAEYKPKNNNKLYFEKDCITQIKEILALIKVHKGHIKPSCGLHCHIDMSKFNNQEIVNIVKYFIFNQDKIIKDFVVLKSRLRRTTKKVPFHIYKKIKKSTIKDIKRDYYLGKEDYFNDRYYLLNLQSLNKHKTLEFRLSNGTIQIRKIRHYIRWCIEFCLKGANFNKNVN